MTRPMEWTPERIARFWANESRTPGNYFTFQFGRRMAKAIAPHVRGCTDLLDYGAGPGFLVRHLARPGLRITAADTSPEAVEAARRNNAGVPGFRGAWLVEELRRSGETFGAVVAAETVEHIDDAGLALFFEDMRRFLARGGRLVITTPNEEDLDLARVYCPACDQHFHRWQHVRSWSGETLSAVLSREGFQVVSVLKTDFAAPRIPSWRTVARRILGRERAPHLLVAAERR